MVDVEGTGGGGRIFTVVHLAAAVAENESVVQLVCCQMKDEVLATQSDKGQTALQVALGLSQGGSGAALYLARRSSGLEYLKPDERQALLKFAVVQGSVRIVAQAKPWKSEVQAIEVELVQLGVRAGQSEALGLLLETLGQPSLGDAKYNEGLPNQMSLLHVAAERGYFGCIALLCKYGAHVNGVESAGRTPLYLSARLGHISTVQELCKNGVNINQAEKNGISLLVATGILWRCFL